MPDHTHRKTNLLEFTRNAGGCADECPRDEHTCVNFVWNPIEQWCVLATQGGRPPKDGEGNAQGQVVSLVVFCLCLDMWSQRRWIRGGPFCGALVDEFIKVLNGQCKDPHSKEAEVTITSDSCVGRGALLSQRFARENENEEAVGEGNHYLEPRFPESFSCLPMEFVTQMFTFMSGVEFRHERSDKGESEV